MQSKLKIAVRVEFIMPAMYPHRREAVKCKMKPSNRTPKSEVKPFETLSMWHVIPMYQ